MTIPGDDFQIGVVCSRGADPSKGGRPYNEDNFLVCDGRGVRYRDGEREHVEQRQGFGVLVAVADGMGGHQHGELAASAAVQALSRLFFREPPRDPESALHSFMVQGHRKLRARALQSKMGDIGTTLVALWVLGHVAYWAHVGDSRLYLIRGESVTQLSRDHTRGEFARRDGRAAPSRPRGLAQSFIFGSRGIGCDGDVRVDAGTDTGEVTLLAGDVLLMCTDGLSNFIPHHRLARAVRELPDPQECARHLVMRAIEAGSDDNITALLLRVVRSPHEPDVLTLW